MTRTIPSEREAQIRWRVAHPEAPQSHEWGISDRAVLLAEVDRLRAQVRRMEWQPTLFAVPGVAL